MTATPPGTAPDLSPAQHIAFERLVEALAVSPIVGLAGPAGCGKSRILEALAAAQGGRHLDVTDIYAACRDVPPAKWEEAVEALVLDALQPGGLVMLDDFGRLNTITIGAGLRGGFFTRMVMPHLVETAIARGASLILVGPPAQPWQMSSDVFGERAAVVQVPDFTSRDYAAIVRAQLGEAAHGVDFASVFRYASMLNAHQLTLACRLLGNRAALDTDAFIACMQDHVLFSNTRIDEVEALSFDTLPGAEEIVEELETHLILPFENRDLASRMGLKPKRGVLLYGPPGTGKTSIGRALAHRIKGKFFLIDGSYISEPPAAFFARIQNTVQEAKVNSPSVLFIDDADVLFGIQHIAGLVRYLLSLLDGLESETASNVCVMMTAMDVRHIPDALLRSGRVELWLETRAPDAANRARILERWMGTEMPGHEEIAYPLLAQATEGFVAADLRRITADAKSLYAADLVAGRQPSRAMAYAAAAINEIIRVRGEMATLLDDPSIRVGHYLDYAPDPAPVAAVPARVAAI